jgi:hypothetical protein
MSEGFREETRAGGRLAREMSVRRKAARLLSEGGKMQKENGKKPKILWSRTQIVHNLKTSVCLICATGYKYVCS